MNSITIENGVMFMKVRDLIKPILPIFKHDCKNCPGCSEKSIQIKIVHKNKETDEFK